MQSARLAYVYTFLTILGWGGAATAFKLALRHIEPLQLLLHSVWISLLILCLLLLYSARWRDLTNLKPGQWVYLLALGALNPFLYYMILFQAYDRLPGQVAMSLNYLWPVMLALLSVPILKQQLKPVAVLAILLSFAGALLIATGGDFSAWNRLDGIGVMLALVSTLVWATYWLLSARMPLDATVKLAVGFLSGSVLAWGYALTVSDMELIGDDWPWLAIGYVGVLEMGLTFFLWLKALQLAPNAARIGHFIYLTPFISLLILALVLGEKIQPATLLGLSIIIAGIIMQQAWTRRSQGADA